MVFLSTTEYCKSTAHCRCVTSPPFNPLWLIQWLSVAAKRSAARKQSTQLTVAARATRETSRQRDASVAAAAEIARALRRSVDSNWEDTVAGDASERMADTIQSKGENDAARRGWSRTRVQFDLRRVVQSIALQLRPGTSGINLARFPLIRGAPLRFASNLESGDSTINSRKIVRNFQILYVLNVRTALQLRFC